MHIPMQSYQASEHNHHPKSFIFLPSQRPKKQPLLWFFSLEKFPCSRISLKWKSHSMNYFYIASFTWHNFWESSILFCKYQKVTAIPRVTYSPLGGGLAVSSFELLIKLLWLYTSLSMNMFSFLNSEVARSWVGACVSSLRNQPIFLQSICAIFTFLPTVWELQLLPNLIKIRCCQSLMSAIKVDV